MESYEDLLNKVATYNNQLEQINNVLVADPSNEQFLQIKKDLLHLIDLTNTLIQTSTTTPVPNTVDVEVEEEDDDDDDALDVEDAFISNTILKKSSHILIGDRVEIKTVERTYAAVVLNIEGDSCTLKYFEYEQPVTLPLASVVHISPVEVGAINDVELKIPFACQAKYASDGQWYDVTVHSKTKYGYNIVYTQYGNKEEVPLEYLRHKPSSSKKPSTTAEAVRSLITIPANLKILPTDTEEEKTRKRKKIKAIKSKNRVVQQEVNASEAQSSWQKFVHKGAKKALPGVVKSSSIFSSTDTVAGKIGVSNSGKGLTEFQTRKKHKFEA